MQFHTATDVAQVIASIWETPLVLWLAVCLVFRKEPCRALIRRTWGLLGYIIMLLLILHTPHPSTILGSVIIFSFTALFGFIDGWYFVDLLYGWTALSMKSKTPVSKHAYVTRQLLSLSPHPSFGAMGISFIAACVALAKSGVPHTSTASILVTGFVVLFAVVAAQVGASLNVWIWKTGWIRELAHK